MQLEIDDSLINDLNELLSVERKTNTHTQKSMPVNIF